MSEAAKLSTTRRMLKGRFLSIAWNLKKHVITLRMEPLAWLDNIRSHPTFLKSASSSGKLTAAGILDPAARPHVFVLDLSLCILTHPRG